MAKTKRWVIVGKVGLYIGQMQTRADAIADHVHNYRGIEGVPDDISQFVHGRGLSPEQRKAWAWRKRCGDRCVHATISY